jgi:hypothetical protein
MARDPKQVIDSLMREALDKAESANHAKQLKEELNRGTEEEQMRKIALALVLWAYDSKECSREQFVDCVWGWLVLCGETTKQQLAREELKSVLGAPDAATAGVAISLKLVEILSKSSIAAGITRQKLVKFHEELAKREKS